MQLYRTNTNSRQRVLTLFGMLGLGVLIAGVAPAHAQIGGFQSNTSGAIVIQFTSIPGSGNIEFAGTGGLLAAAASLSGSDLSAAGTCVGTTFPDSSQRERFENALSDAAKDIDSLKSNIQSAVPSEDTVNPIALNQAGESSTKARNSLLELTRATMALPRNGSAEQDACIQDVFAAIEKAVSALERTVPELKSVMTEVNALR